MYDECLNMKEKATLNSSTQIIFFSSLKTGEYQGLLKLIVRNHQDINMSH